MVWAAIGTAAVGFVGNAYVSHQNNKAADARAENASASKGANPTTAADPFADQRFAYQNQLKQLMSGGVGASGDPMLQQRMGQLATGALDTNSATLSNKLTGMLTDTTGGKALADDPAYRFRLDQGRENLNRGAAASGMLDSGNRLAELETFGQNQASQEYANQFQRLASGVGATGALDQQNFGHMQAVDANAQTMFANNYSRLAQLSGANSGSPGGAAQIMAGQQAGASAQISKYADMAVKAGGKLWDMATDGGHPSGSTGTMPDGSVDTSYGTYADQTAPVQPPDEQTW